MKISAAASATPVPTSEQDRLGSIALDQWRGLALVLVLIFHGFFFTDRVNGIGRVGVNLFFFISGILVFRSLSRTRAATDRERARDEMDGRTGLFDLFVTAALHDLHVPAEPVASGRRCVVSFFRTAVLERGPTQMKGALCLRFG